LWCDDFTFLAAFRGWEQIRNNRVESQGLFSSIIGWHIQGESRPRTFETVRRLKRSLHAAVHRRRVGVRAASGTPPWAGGGGRCRC
jgi:hypothetical protein